MPAANGGTPEPGRSCQLPADSRVDWIFAARLPLTGYTADASGLGTISDHRMILTTLSQPA